MPTWVLEYILWYYERDPQCERPAWANGVLWFHNMLPANESLAHLPWDFGIYNDYQFMRMMRMDPTAPFSFAPDFHRRMSERRSQLKEFNRMPRYVPVTYSRAPRGEDEVYDSQVSDSDEGSNSGMRDVSSQGSVAMELLRDKNLAPEGMTLAAFGEAVRKWQVENGIVSGENGMSHWPRGDIFGNP